MDDTERFFRAYSTRFDSSGRKIELKNCAVHGLNATHSTDTCKFLHDPRGKGTEQRRATPIGNFRPRGTLDHHSRYDRDRERSRSPYTQNYPNRTRSSYNQDFSDRSRSPFTQNRRDRSNSRSRSRDRNSHHSSNTSNETQFKPRRAGQEDTKRPKSPYNYRAYTTELDLDTKLRDANGQPILTDIGDLYANVTIYCSLSANRKEEMRREFLADCAAFKIIINRCHENLIENLEPCTGDIYGACGVSLGAVTAQGFIRFLGVRMRCYLADTEVSVFSIGESCVYHGFRTRVPEPEVPKILGRYGGKNFSDHFAADVVLSSCHFKASGVNLLAGKRAEIRRLCGRVE
jgi:hypothetical protein